MTTKENPFNTVSDVERSQRRRYYEIFDEFVLAPLRIIREDTRALIGGGILLVFGLMGTVGPVLTETPEPDPSNILMPPFQSLQYPLGTDNVGRDLLTMIFHATPAMFEMIFAGAVFATVLGTFIGLIAGYKGGMVDIVLSTITDIALTIPGLPLTIVLAIYLNPSSPWMIGLILMINGWGGLARSIRSEALSLREESYVEASRVMGTSTTRIVVKDMLPNIMPYVFMNFMRNGRGIIFSSVGLYFLGILPYTALNWGVILNRAWGANAIFRAEMYHWLLVPLFIIVVFTYGLTLFAQGTDRLFNPRVRARHTKDE